MLECLSDQFIYFCIILITNQACVQSRISHLNLQNINEYLRQEYEKINTNLTNFVFQPDRNSPPLPPDTSTVELIKRNGYPLEVYHVITEDGYILKVFRIPCGRIKKCNNASKSYEKPPVLALHPNLFTVDIWMYSLRVENNLPFVLADFGYDVWLPNLRGTSYSNTHLFYDISQEEYWDFSLDEYGEYDVRALIEFILEKTGKPKLHFISYSGSTYAFFIAMTKYSYLNEKIALNVAYAPAMFNEKLGVLHYIIAASLVDYLQLIQASGGGAFPSYGISQIFSKTMKRFCLSKLDSLGYCRYLLFAVGGFANISKEQISPMIEKGLSVPSLKVIIQFLQILTTGEFREYDYGAVGNLRVYGKPHSPKYDLQKVTAPVAIVQAPFDVLVPNESTAKLANNLPNVVDYYVIPNKEFAHVDFCCGEHNTIVFSHTLKLLNQFSYGIA